MKLPEVICRVNINLLLLFKTIDCLLQYHFDAPVIDDVCKTKLWSVDQGRTKLGFTVMMTS